MSDRPPFASAPHAAIAPGTPLETKCYWCGLRRGLHRWGDERCPNLQRRDSNGCFGWSTDTTFWDMRAK